MLPTPSLDSLLAELNEQQRAAAGHPRDPLLIIAGAGTGKTATLAHRVAWLIATGADPGRILLLTFTRRAAAEMLRRVDQILERSGQKLGRDQPGLRRSPDLGRHLPRSRQSALAAALRLGRPAAGVHHSRSGRFRRSDAGGACSSGIGRFQNAVPPQGDVSRYLQPLRELSQAARRSAGDRFSLVPSASRRAQRALPRVCRSQRVAGRARLR